MRKLRLEVVCVYGIHLPCGFRRVIARNARGRVNGDLLSNSAWFAVAGPHEFKYGAKAESDARNPVAWWVKDS